MVVEKVFSKVPVKFFRVVGAQLECRNPNFMLTKPFLQL